MKSTSILIALLGISICSASFLDNYQTCTKEEINDDQFIEEVLNYGCDQLYQTAIQDNKVKSSPYNITNSATQVYKQSYTTGTAYTCSVSLSNNQGETVNGVFTVYYDSKSGSKSFLDCSYSVKCKETVSSTYDKGTYVAATMDDVSKIQECVNYGVNNVLVKAEKKGKITGSGYKINKLVSVTKKVQKSGTFYKFSVEVSNMDDCLLIMEINVYYQTSTKKKVVVSYSYTVKKIAKPTKPTTNDYEEVKNYEDNADAKDCLDYGLQQTVEKYKDYEVSNVNGVWKYDTGNGQGDCYYKYEVALNDKNKKDQTATCAFTIWYNSYSKEKQVQTYSYKTTTTTTTTTTNTASSTSSSNDGSYTQIPPEEVYTNPKYKSVADYGVQKCLKSLSENGVISKDDNENDDSYAVSDVAKALVKKEDNIETYKMRINLKNENGVKLEANFDVQYKNDNSNSGENSNLSLSWYSVRGSCPVKTGDVVIVDCNTKPNTSTNTNYDNKGDDDDEVPNVYDNDNNDDDVPNMYDDDDDDDVPNVYDNNNDQDDDNNNNYEDNTDTETDTDTDTDTDTQVDVGNYQNIDNDAYSIDSEAQECVKYGVQETVKQVVTKENLPTQDYQVQEVRNVCKDNDNGGNYRVDAVLVDSKGSTLDCSFSVSKDVKTGEKKLTSCSYATY